MTVTPQAGYQVDPNNPNGVIPIGTGPTGFQQTQTAGGVSQGTVNTSAAPQTTPTVTNPNANYFSQPVNTAQPSPTTVNATPYTGTSVVDALNQGGQASDFNSRTKLAQQYGISNYTGTADQNTALLQKYQGGLATAKAQGVQSPTTTGAGSSMVNGITGGPTQMPQVNPIDTLLGQDPGYQKLLTDYKAYTDSNTQRETLVDQYSRLQKESGLPEINTELLNDKKIIDGTEQDIRNEVSASGGFATESQVQALASARNKTLIQNYNNLLSTRDNAVQNINTMIGLSQQDRSYAQQQFQTQMNFDQQLMEYKDKFINNAKESYNAIINSQGYAGLYNAVSQDPNATALVEKTLGLQPGGLAQLAGYTAPLSQMDQADLENKQLQNKKLKQDLSGGGSVPTQVVDLNGKKVLINSKTGAIISEIGGGANGGTNDQQQAQAKGNIDLISSLTTNSALNSAVGPNSFARFSPLASINGTKSNFIAGVQQLTSQLSLDSLVRAKAQGATFGALSEGELNLLSSSASKLNSWANKDKNGNVTGYTASEKDFKAELDKINNFAKLDYVLKGGDPTTIGVQRMPNGKYVTANSDGTYTELN